MKRLLGQWVIIAVVLCVVVALIDGLKVAEAACNAPPSGPEYDLAVIASADATVVPVGSNVNFSYTATTSDGLHLPPQSVIWSPYGAVHQFTSPGIYTNWVTVANPLDDYSGPCAVSNFVAVTVFNVKIKAPSGASAPSGVYVGSSVGYSAVVTPSGLAGSYVWTKTGAGIVALVGDLSQTVSIEAGALPSVSVNAEKLNVKFTPDGSAESSQDSALLTVVEVNAVSVDASSDIGPTKINYKMKPAGAAYPATFTAPGITESRPSVGDDFFYNYSPNDLGDGDNPIKLTCLGHEVTFMATKTPESKGPAKEEVIATILWDTKGAVGYVNIPIQHDILVEAYYIITYGVPVLPGGYTLQVRGTAVKVMSGPAYPIGIVAEKHRYEVDGGTYSEIAMTLDAGPTLDPPLDYRKYFNSGADRYFRTGRGLTGFAQLDDIAFTDEGGNNISPLNLLNEDTDQELE